MYHNHYCRDCTNYTATNINGIEIAAWCRHNECRRTHHSEACPAYTPKKIHNTP